MIATTMTPYLRKAGTEYSAWFAGGLTTFLATGEDTDGKFGLIDSVALAGTEPPPHIHTNEDECFYILEGRVTFTVDGQELGASAGGWAVIPKGTVHTFKVEGESARMLVYFTPAGFERFFMELSEPATSLTEPPVADGPPDIAHILDTAAKYGCEFVK